MTQATSTETKELNLNPEQLGEEIRALNLWIEPRSEEIERIINDLTERTRNLQRLCLPADEIEGEYEKLEDLQKELSSLDELRQVRAFKKALLRKLDKGII